MKLTKIDTRSEEVKKTLTAYQLENLVPVLLENLKNDDGKIDLTWEAEALANLFGCSDVIEAKAQVARYYRTWESFGETEDLDVWVEVTARDASRYARKYAELGAYLTDIWAIAGDNRDEIRSRCFANVIERT